MNNLVTVLDPGDHPGGSSIVTVIAGRTVLVDGGHPDHLRGRTPTLLEQLQELQGQARPEVDLLVVTHAHMDRIGALPELVDSGRLVVGAAILPDRGLAWGRPIAYEPASAVPTDADRVVAALREEAVPAEAAAAQLADAVDLERRFGRLVDAVTRLEIPYARHGIDRPTAAGPVVTEVGLRVLGPSTDVHVVAADDQAKTSQAARLLLDQYEPAPPTALLSALRRDLGGTAANAVNQQCPALLLVGAGPPVLLSGDHPSPRPDDSAVVVAAHESIVAAVAAAAPVMEIVGRSEPLHGGSTTFGSGRSSDGTGEGVDVLGSYSVSPTRPHTPRPRPALSAATERAVVGPAAAEQRTSLGPGRDGDTVEVTVCVPKGATAEVTVTARGKATVSTRPATDATADAATDAAPDRRLDRRVGIARPSATGLRITPLRRPTAKLLWVTQPGLLAGKIGEDEAAEILASLSVIDQEVVLDLPMSTSDPRSTAARVAAQIDGHDGVVLLGDHDVVPSARLRCAENTERHTDHDDWLVWSDDLYGDTTGDTVPNVPVTRVPDGGDADFLLRVLQPAANPDRGSLAAIHNKARTYVPRIARKFDAESNVLPSAPYQRDKHDPALLSGSVTYLVLHGSARRSTELSGESDAGQVIALHIDDIEPAATEVVLSGCCWGGLVLDRQATSTGRVRPRRSADCIPLRFLAAGARAFIGPTGSHYSPGKTQANAVLVGSAFHPMVLDRLANGEAPAQALHGAKIEFLGTIPERIGRQRKTNASKVRLAEMKTWRQYTSLGLGWFLE